MAHVVGAVSVRLLGFLLAVLVATAQGQFTGTFVDGAGKEHPWRISTSNALIWEDKAWLPLGPRVGQQDAARLPAVAASGLQSAMLSFSFASPLQPFVDTAESAGLAYCLTPNTSPQNVSGYLAMPQSYRMAGIKTAQEIALRLPGADWAFFVLADAETSEISQSGRCNVEGGTARIPIKPKRPGSYVLLLYPHTPSGNMPDYWGGYDVWRDALIAKVRATSFGPRLRGLVDPLGEVGRWYDPHRRLVPDSALYRFEFERHLRRTYAELRQLNEQWRVSGKDFESYREAAAVVPLFSEGRGVPYLWNPETDGLRPAEIGGKFWKDFDSFLLGIIQRRTNDLAVALQRVLQVPVVFTWVGWDIEQSMGQGVGMRAFGQGNGVAETWCAQALGSSLTWSNKPWLLATDVAAAADGQAFGGDVDAGKTIDALGSLGAKGAFVRTALDDASLRKLAALIPRLPAPDFTPITLRFPETVRSPAEIMSLPGGVWWVPSPVVGARLDYGDEYDAYKFSSPEGTVVVIWSRVGNREEFFHFADPAKVKVTTYDGTTIQPKTKKDGMTLMVTDMPTVFTVQEDLPVPATIYKATRRAIEDWFKLDTRPGVSFSDLKLDFDNAVNGFARNPGNSYSSLRDTYNKIASRAGNFIWIEGEKPTKTTFGYTATSMAAGDGRYLAVDTPFEPVDGSYGASYGVTLTADAPMRLLIAGRLPSGGTLRFEWKLDEGPVTDISTTPVSGYGDAFWWYDAGPISLPHGRHTLTLQVRGETGAYYDAAIDAVLLAPVDFKPSGVRRPSVRTAAKP